MYRIYETAQTSYVHLQIFLKTSNMHNFVILSPNSDFQESILVKISQATRWFRHILSKQSRNFQKLPKQTRSEGKLACKERDEFLTQRARKTWRRCFGEALSYWNGTTSGSKQARPGFLHRNTHTHTYTCMHIGHVFIQREGENRRRDAHQVRGEKEEAVVVSPVKRGGRRWR